MQNFAVMYMLKSKTNLREPIEDMILTPVLQSATILFSILIFGFNSALKVSTVSEIHDDTQLALLCFVNLSESNNIGMLKYLQNFGLTQCFPSFLFTHVLNINLLDNC